MEPQNTSTSSSKGRPSRRKLLLGGAAGAAAVVAAYTGGWWWFKVRSGDTEDLVVSVLRRNLRGLAFAEEDMRSFARAVQGRFSSNRRLALLGMLGPLYEHIHVYKLLPRSYQSFRRFEDAVVGDFLLSTDFFEHRPEPEAPLTYHGLHDTYSRICANPFAQLDES
jgi:hypothetical protein